VHPTDVAHAAGDDAARAGEAIEHRTRQHDRVARRTRIELFAHGAHGTERGGQPQAAGAFELGLQRQHQALGRARAQQMHRGAGGHGFSSRP
jgi:hypothetical protein